jgi:transposase
MREIFAERLPGVVSHYARWTERLAEWFTHVSFALSGKAEARLLKDLGVLISGETLLNHVRARQFRRYEPLRVLSVDDIALRSGTRYGTVLVDLERRRLVDVLPQNVARITCYLKEQECLSRSISDRPPSISAIHAAGSS